MKRIDAKRFGIFCIILAIVILIIAVIVAKVVEKKRVEDLNVEYSDENLYFEDSSDITSDEMPTDFVPFNNVNLAMEAADAVKRIGVSAYSTDAMMGILDDMYIEYYGLTKDNIANKVSSYKKVKYNIKDVKLARYNSIFLCLVTTDDGKNFLFKYDELNKTYTLFLDDYCRELGIDGIKAKMSEIINEIPKGSPYTITESIAYLPLDVVRYYVSLTDGFDNFYNKQITSETRNRYSYDQLYELYDNNYSIFGEAFSPVGYTVSVNDKGYNDYTFKDSNGYQYVISENGYFDFTIDVTL